MREKEGGGGGGGGESQRDRDRKTGPKVMRNRLRSGQSLFVGWLLNVPATCECISGTDLLRQFYVLQHRVRSCR